jgi:hypothetical protein
MTALGELNITAVIGGLMCGSLAYKYYEDLHDLFPLEFWMYVAGATLIGASLAAGGYFFSNYAAFAR